MMDLSTRIKKLEVSIGAAPFCRCGKETDAGKILKRYVLPLFGSQKHGTVTSQPCQTCGGLWEVEYRDINQEGFFSDVSEHAN